MIRVRQLVKSFGDQLAVSGLDLEAEQGDILGLIGPNGAGKTTSLRILATLEQADAGHVELAGHDLFTDIEAVRQVVGFMPERFGLYDELTVRDYLEFFGRIHGFDRSRLKRRVDDLIALCDLGTKADAGCGSLSKGVRQRLYVAKTLLSDPPILLLDEPASGLDPRARIEFRELMRELADHGKTILISSHILSELDAICNRVVVVESGRVQFAGAISDLQQYTLIQTIHMRFWPDAAANDAVGFLKERVGVNQVERTAIGISFQFDGDKDQIPVLLKSLVEIGHPVFSFTVEAQGLESLFLSVTEGVVS
jgi:ABC-2 type transport system ATP-binding protein